MSNKTNLLIDLGIFSAFLVASEPRFTGISIHEWLGVAFAAALITHLLLHWKWVIAVGRGFFKKLFHISRFQLILDTFLFLAFVTVTLSGMMISKSVLPFFGIQAQQGFAWRGIHSASANATLALVGIHVALNWKWVGMMTKRYILSPIASIFKPELKKQGTEAREA